MLVEGSWVTDIFMTCRALGGRVARNMRAVFECREKGLNFMVTSERKRGIMFAVIDWAVEVEVEVGDVVSRRWIEMRRARSIVSKPIELTGW